MIKVLAIIGSPRKKGNTYQLVQRVENQLNQLKPDIHVEYVFLSECRLEI